MTKDPHNTLLPYTKDDDYVRDAKEAVVNAVATAVDAGKTAVKMVEKEAKVVGDTVGHVPNDAAKIEQQSVKKVDEGIQTAQKEVKQVEHEAAAVANVASKKVAEGLNSVIKSFKLPWGK